MILLPFFLAVGTPIQAHIGSIHTNRYSIGVRFIQPHTNDGVYRIGVCVLSIQFYHQPIEKAVCIDERVCEEDSKPNSMFQQKKKVSHTVKHSWIQNPIKFISC